MAVAIITSGPQFGIQGRGLRCILLIMVAPGSSPVSEGSIITENVCTQPHITLNMEVLNRSPSLCASYMPFLLTCAHTESQLHGTLNACGNYNVHLFSMSELTLLRLSVSETKTQILKDERYMCNTFFFINTIEFILMQ